MNIISNNGLRKIFSLLKNYINSQYGLKCWDFPLDQYKIIVGKDVYMNIGNFVAQESGGYLINFYGGLFYSNNGFHRFDLAFSREETDISNIPQQLPDFNSIYRKYYSVYSVRNISNMSGGGSSHTFYKDLIKGEIISLFININDNNIPSDATTGMAFGKFIKLI